MALGHLWAGRLFGTNVGNVFVKFDGEDRALKGIVRIADNNLGVVVYDIGATFDGSTLNLEGRPGKPPEGVQVGDLSAEGTLDFKGQIHGEWETTLGTGGTFVLFPHDHEETTAAATTEMVPEADQLHTKRYTFGAIQIDKEQLLTLGDKIQGEFPGRKVVVSITAGTEQSRFLEDFRKLDLPYQKAEIIKLFAQRPELGGVNRMVTVEFGPSVNYAMAQSSDEFWTLGMAERLKRDVKPFERSYAINVRRIGFGINQLLVFWAIVFLPELPSLWWRAGFLAAVLVVAYLNQKFHQRYVPLANIVLSKKHPSWLERIGPSVWSWMSALLAAVAVSVLSAYAKGWLHIPNTSL